MGTLCGEGTSPRRTQNTGQPFSSGGKPTILKAVTESPNPLDPTIWVPALWDSGTSCNPDDPSPMGPSCTYRTLWTSALWMPAVHVPPLYVPSHWVPAPRTSALQSPAQWVAPTGPSKELHFLTGAEDRCSDPRQLRGTFHASSEVSCEDTERPLGTRQLFPGLCIWKTRRHHLPSLPLPPT